MATTTAQCIDSNPFRKVFDTLVFGYLNRQNYMESARCILNESVELRNITCLSTSTVQLNDIVHGKHLEQIMKMFIERGHFDLQPILLDFGNRLRALTNEFTSFTNSDSYWSDAQRTLYGKRIPPNRNTSSESNFIVFPVQETQPKTAHSGSYGAASTRRKSAHPISIDARKKEILKDLVEPVVHSAQQVIDGATSSESNTSQTASSIPIDDTAIGTLERYVANDQLEDIIASLERDMPSTFFDDNNGPSLGNEHFSDNDNDSTFTLEPICLPSQHKQEQQQGCKNTSIWSQQAYSQFAVNQISHLDRNTVSHVGAMPTQVPNADRHIPAINTTQSSFERPPPMSVPRSTPSRCIPSKPNSLVDESKMQSVMWTDLSSGSAANIELHDCGNVNRSMRSDTVESSHSKLDEQSESTPKVLKNSSQDMASVSNPSILAPIRRSSDDTMIQEDRIVADEQIACSSVSNANDEHMPSVTVASNSQDGTNKYLESDESETQNIATPEELHSINEHNAETTIPINDSLKTPEYSSQSQNSYEDLWSNDAASRLISTREHSVANANQREAFDSSRESVQERANELIKEQRPDEGGVQQARQMLRDKRWSAEKANFEKWKRKNDEDMMKRREETGNKSGDSENRNRGLLKGIEKPDNQDLEKERRKIESKRHKENEQKETVDYSSKSRDPELKIKSNGTDRREFEIDKGKGKSKSFEDDETDKSPEDSEVTGVEEQSGGVENVWDKREAENERLEDQIRRKERKRIELEGKLKEGKSVDRRKENNKYSATKVEQERKRTKEEKSYRNRGKDDRDESLEESLVRSENNNEESELSRESEENVEEVRENICRKENLEGGKRVKKDVEKRAKEKEKRKKDELELLEKKRMEEEEKRKIIEENKRKQIEFERYKEEKRRKEVEEEARRYEQEEADKLKKAEESRKVAEENESKRIKDEEEELIRRHQEKVAQLDEERRRLEDELRKRAEKRTKQTVEDSERKRQRHESLSIQEDRRKEKLVEANSGDGKVSVGRSIEDLFGESESLPREELDDTYGTHNQPNSHRESVKEMISNKDEENIADDNVSPVLSTNEVTYFDKSTYDRSDRRDGKWQPKVEEKDTIETTKEKDLTVTEKKKKKLGIFSQSDSRLFVEGKERKLGDENHLKSSSKAKSSSQKEKDDRAKESTISDPEKKKKDRGERLRKEQEEIQRQLREQAEKERKRAVEREKRRREEREGVEREEREKRRRDKEDEREKYKKENEPRVETLSQSSSAERSPRDRKSRDRERISKEQEQDRKRLKPSSSNKERQHVSSSSQPDLSYLFDEESNSSDTSSSKRLKPKTKIISEASKDNSRRHSGIPSSDSVKSIKESSEKMLKRSAEKRSSSVAKAKAISKSNAFLDDLFSTFMAPPSKAGTSSHKDPSPPVEVKPKKTVASGVNKNRKNLLIGGGHSARVGMVLEKATRTRARFEHEERVRNGGKPLLNRASLTHDNAQQPSSSSSTSNEHSENRKTVEGYLKSLGCKLSASPSNTQRSDKDSLISTNSRKRILDLPIPKTISLDLVGEILAPKQTQVERYVPTKPTAQQNQFAFSSISSGNSPSISCLPAASSSPVAPISSASCDVGDDNSPRVSSAYTQSTGHQSQTRDLQQSSMAFASTGSTSSSSTPATPSSLLQSPQHEQSSSSAPKLHNSQSGTTASSSVSKNATVSSSPNTNPNVTTSSSTTSTSSSPASNSLSDSSTSATPTAAATATKRPRLDGNAISSVLNALHNWRR